MKPNKEIRKRYFTDYRDSSVFASRARLLQSIWRTENNYDFEKYGNYLPLKFSIESGANFLTRNIFEIVKSEVEAKHLKSKVIKEPRIWNNLLSSQPLAFNLFGELKLNPKLATKVFKKLFPNCDVKTINEIIFEHSPGRSDPKYTEDKSALDVFISYLSEENEERFFGIEVKYSEDLDDPPSTHKKIYEDISKKSGTFDLVCISELKKKPLQQIWRDHLLTLSMFITNQDYKQGEFIFLYPQDNKECENALNSYQETFKESVNSHFHTLTLERLVNTIKTFSDERWVLDFENRYLDFSKVDKLTN